MPHAGQGSGPVPAFNIDARAIQSFLLQASGARERACDYCGSTIPVGERACQGCGAAVSTMAPQEHGNGSGDRNQWIVPLLLCFFFPPAMLIVLPDHFTWAKFLQTTASCAAGVFLLGMALTGYALRIVPGLFRWLLGIGGLMLVVPGSKTDMIAIAVLVPVLIQQMLALRRPPPAPT